MMEVEKGVKVTNNKGFTMVSRWGQFCGGSWCVWLRDFVEVVCEDKMKITNMRCRNSVKKI